MYIIRNLAAASIFLILLTIGALANNHVRPSLTIKDSQPTGMYETGQKVTFTISLENVDLSSPELDAHYRVLVNGEEAIGHSQITANPTTVTTIVKETGFISCEASMTKPVQLEQSRFVGVDPHKLQAQTTLPPDFIDYWNSQKARLEEVPMNPVVKEVEIPQEHLKGKVRVYDILVDCAGNTPVTAYLAMPADASKEKQYPIRVSFHGHSYFPGGSAIRSTEAVFEKAIFLDVNLFGVTNGESKEYYQSTIWKELRNNEGAYPYRKWESRDEVYFNGIFLRVVRALEYAKTRPEWDGKNLIVEGSSMGGAQALVGAALDPQVSACVANVPAMGDLLATTPSWPYLMKHAKAAPEAIEENAPYYDMVNFARSIKVPTIVGVGLNDALCPPPNVWAIFNNLQGPKEIVVSVDGVHNWNREMREALPAWIKAQIK